MSVFFFCCTQQLAAVNWPKCYLRYAFCTCLPRKLTANLRAEQLPSCRWKTVKCTVQSVQLKITAAAAEDDFELSAILLEFRKNKPLR